MEFGSWGVSTCDGPTLLVSEFCVEAAEGRCCRVEQGRKSLGRPNMAARARNSHKMASAWFSAIASRLQHCDYSGGSEEVY